MYPETFLVKPARGSSTLASTLKEIMALSAI